MPDPLSFLVPGVDLSALPLVDSDCGVVQGATISDFDNLVRGAQPASTIGFVVSSPTAPDTATYPILKNFLWRKTQGAPPYQVYEYNPNTFSWEIVSPCPINGSCITEGSLSLSKISVPGGVGNYIVVVNATSTGITLSTITGLLVTDTVPLSALQVPAGAPLGSVLTVVSSGLLGFQPINISELIASLGPGAIKLSQVKRDTAGIAGHQLILDSDGRTIITAAQPSVPELLPTPAALDAGKFIVVNPAGNGYILAALTSLYPNVANYKIETSAQQTMPAGVGTVTLAHGLGVVPAFVKIYLYCITADVIWSVGDVVPADELIQVGNSGPVLGVPVLFNSLLTATNIKVTATYTTALNQGPALYRTDNNLYAIITLANWKFFFIAQRA